MSALRWHCHTPRFAGTSHVIGGGSESRRTCNLRPSGRSPTREARQTEKEALQAKAWDLWLDCCATQREIAEQLDLDQATISRWLDANTASADFASPPVSRQHFDIWQFQTSDKDSGQQSYFGAMPPQVIENLL
jgi:hypothetical protein